LRAAFPVIQRMQWTKWDALELFVHCLMQAMPSQSTYLNLARPAKFHRLALHSLNLAAVFLASSLMLTFSAPTNEAITALDRSTLQLFIDLFTQSFQGEIIGVALIAGGFGGALEGVVKWIFFGYRVPTNQPPLSTQEAQTEQLRFWHELAMMGQWVCVAINIVGWCGTLTLCATAPQPRAVGVVRTYLLVCLVVCVLLPLAKASGRFYILSTARKTRAWDGLLNVYPAIMDFEHVGVVTSEYLAWRMNKIIQEEELMRRVYEAADGRYDDIADMLQEELQLEAETFKQAVEEERLEQEYQAELQLMDGTLQ